MTLPCCKHECELEVLLLQELNFAASLFGCHIPTREITVPLGYCPEGRLRASKQISVHVQFQEIRLVGVTHMKVQVPQFSHVSAHHLVAVAEDDLAQIEREQHIQEQDLVCPYQTLLLCLQMQSVSPTLCTAPCSAAQRIAQHSIA